MQAVDYGAVLPAVQRDHRSVLRPQHPRMRALRRCGPGHLDGRARRDPRRGAVAAGGGLRLPHGRVCHVLPCAELRQVLLVALQGQAARRAVSDHLAYLCRVLRPVAKVGGDDALRARRGLSRLRLLWCPHRLSAALQLQESAAVRNFMAARAVRRGAAWFRRLPLACHVVARATRRRPAASWHAGGGASHTTRHVPGVPDGQLPRVPCLLLRGIRLWRTLPPRRLLPRLQRRGRVPPRTACRVDGDRPLPCRDARCHPADAVCRAQRHLRGTEDCALTRAQLPPRGPRSALLLVGGGGDRQEAIPGWVCRAHPAWLRRAADHGLRIQPTVPSLFGHRRSVHRPRGRLLCKCLQLHPRGFFLSLPRPQVRGARGGR